MSLLALCTACTREPKPFEAASSHAALSALQVGPELRVDGGASTRRAFYAQTAAVSFGGGRHFIAWADGRRDDWTIFGNRFDTTGAVQAVDDISLAHTVHHQLAPAVASDGNNFIVAYSELFSSESFEYEVYVSRVAADGTALDTVPRLIRGAPTDIAPAIAFNGTDYLVVWSETSNASGSASRDIFAMRVDTSGQVRDPMPIAVSTATGEQQLPQVTRQGTDWLVVWQDGRGATQDIYAARVAANGTVLDTTGVAVSTAAGNQTGPAAVCDGTATNCLVTWQDERATPRVYGARMQGSTVVDVSGVPFGVAATAACAAKPASDGTQFMVTWTDSPTSCAVSATPVVRVQRLDVTGPAVGTAQVVSSSARRQNSPSIDYDGSGYFITWQEGFPGPFNQEFIFGRRIDTNGVPTAPPVLLTNRSGTLTALPWQTQPSAAFDGTNATVVWRETNDSNLPIVGARFTPDGIQLDTPPQVLCVGAGSRIFPTLSYGAGHSFVSWVALLPSIHLEGLFFRPDGGFTPCGKFNYAPANQSHAWLTSTYGAGRFALTWARTTQPATTGHDVDGYLLSADGGNTDTVSFTLAGQVRNQIKPVVMPFDSDFVALWDDTPGGRVRTLSTRGFNTTATLGAASMQPRSDGGFRTSVQVAQKTGARLAVYLEDGDVYATFVERDGGMGTGIPLTTSPHTEASPVVAFDGQRYLAVWVQTHPGQSDDVIGRVIEPDGGLGVETVIAGSPSAYEYTPAVTEVGDGRFLVAYVSADPTGDGGLDGNLSPRLVLRTLTVTEVMAPDAGTDAGETGIGMTDAGSGDEVPVLQHQHFQVGCSASSNAPTTWAILTCLLLASLLRFPASKRQ